MPGNVCLKKIIGGTGSKLIYRKQETEIRTMLNDIIIKKICPPTKKKLHWTIGTD